MTLWMRWIPTWERMMNKKSCVHCKFFGDDIVKGYKVGVCRRYAPRFISGVGTGETSQRFPMAYPDEWCGEYIEDLDNGYSEPEDTDDSLESDWCDFCEMSVTAEPVQGYLRGNCPHCGNMCS